MNRCKHRGNNFCMDCGQKLKAPCLECGNMEPVGREFCQEKAREAERDLVSCFETQLGSWKFFDPNLRPGPATVSLLVFALSGVTATILSMWPINLSASNPFLFFGGILASIVMAGLSLFLVNKFLLRPKKERIKKRFLETHEEYRGMLPATV